MQLVTTLIYVSIGLLIVIVLFGYVLDMGWVGVRGIKQEGGTSYKTLWDWMDLLIVPTVLALGGLLLSQAQEVRQQELLNQRDDDVGVQGCRRSSCSTERTRCAPHSGAATCAL